MEALWAKVKIKIVLDIYKWDSQNKPTLLCVAVCAKCVKETLATDEKRYLYTFISAKLHISYYFSIWTTLMKAHEQW